MIKEDITANPHVPQLWYSAFFAKWIGLVSFSGSKTQSGLNIAGKIFWVNFLFLGLVSSFSLFGNFLYLQLNFLRAAGWTPCSPNYEQRWSLVLCTYRHLL